MDFVATIAGTHRGCELIDVPALATSIFGGATEVTEQATVCGGGLGIEDWWTYDTTDLGQGGTASVNMANGNLVVKQTDSTPVQSRGQLALALGRAYNSQDLMDGSGPIGAGWQLDIGETGLNAGGFGLEGLSLPNLQNVTQPLSMPYIDRDGTRHVFKLRSVGASVGNAGLAIDLSNPGSFLLSLLGLDGDDDNVQGSDAYKDLLDDTNAFIDDILNLNFDVSKICVDQAYTGPPGTNMFLFRYIGVGASGCSNPAVEDTITAGWSLIRPDRVRYDFNAAGDLTGVTDPSGERLVYTPGVLYGPTQIRTCNDEDEQGCRSISIDYNAGDPFDDDADRQVDVTDSAGRLTTFIVDRNAFVPQLKEVWEPGNPYEKGHGTPSTRYTYSTASRPCDSEVDVPNATHSKGQLCSVTDAQGGTTTFTYEAAPIGPDRVKTVTDRRGNVPTDGGQKGLATKYTWDDDADYVTADMGAPVNIDNCAGVSCQRIRYSDIDDAGRVGQVAEGSANNTFLRQTGYFWDGEENGTCSQPSDRVNNNLCQVIRRAVPSNDPFVMDEVGTGTVDGVTVHDEATDYQYGDLGQTLRQKVLLDASQEWTDENSAITTWGTNDQYFDANGDQRTFNNHVRGNGEVRSSASPEGYRRTVLDDDPIGYWRLDETGSNAGDAMVSQTGTNNGTYTGVEVRGAEGAIPGNAAIGEAPGNISGLISNLTGFAHGTSATDSDFTVEAWTKTTSTNLHTTFAWGPSSNKYGGVGRVPGGLPYVYLVTDASANELTLAVANVSVADDEWHHLAYTYDGSGDADGISIWIDGEKAPMSIIQDTMDGEFAPAPTSALLGQAAEAGSFVDEVAIYDRVLDDAAVQRHGNVGNGNDRIEPDTLYAVTDQIQELSPRGNAAASWGDHLTTTRRDIPAPGTTAPTNQPDRADICGSLPRGNSGFACEVVTPAASSVTNPTATCEDPAEGRPAGSPVIPRSGSARYACTTYTYNGSGQRTTMRTPKAHAEGSTREYTYGYYGPAAKDLSDTATADGWLKAIVDPDGERVVHAYDAAGNIARSWDRNATHGEAVEADWTDAASPPSTEYSSTVSATPVTSDALSVSNEALMVVGPDGTVTGTGSNAGGQLGDDSTTARATPVRAKGLKNVVEVDQTGTDAFVACNTTFYRTGDGKVWTSGAGNDVPVQVEGLKDIVSIAAGTCGVLALDGRGKLWRWSAGATATKILDDVSTMASGFAHSLAVTTDGRVWAWGANDNGQLGLGNRDTKSSPTQVPGLTGVRAVAAGVTSSYALTRDGKAWAWGANSLGELGIGNTTEKTEPTRITTLGAGTSAGEVRQIVGGAFSAAALMSDGTVRAWGFNNVGQLGSSTGDGFSHTPLKVPALADQVAIAGGWATIATADEAGDIRVFGSTSNNQLANGSAPSTSAPTVAGIDASPFRKPWRYVLGSRDATARQSTMSVDTLGNTRSVRPGRGHATFTSAFDQTVGYDAAQRPLWSISPENRKDVRTATVDYDPFGNAVTSTDPRGIATKTEFDQVNRPRTELFTRAADQAPDVCSYGTAGVGWPAGQQGHKLCAQVATYDGADRTVLESDRNIQITKMWNDAAGRATRVDVPRSANDYKTTRQVFDRDGNVVRTCLPRQFDAANESSTTTDCAPGGRHSIHQTWDPAGNMAAQTRYRDATALTTSMDYDADANPTAVTDANGHTTTSTFDLQGRRLTQTKPRSSTVSHTSSWSYDFSGNVTAVRAPGSINTGSGVDGNLVVDGLSGAGTSDGTAHGAANPFVIPDGAQYRNVTLRNGAAVTAEDPNGLMFHATGTVQVCSSCSIDMGGRGDAGGAAAPTGGADGGNAPKPNPGRGGKGGGGDSLGAASGGGGGGHADDGSPGQGGKPGAPGLKSGSADFSGVGTDYLEAVGGAGGGGGRGPGGTAGKGGDGGGYVRVTATKIVIDGTINASGANGATANADGGGGGGGAGGGIWLAAPDIDLANAGVLDVDGGLGGIADGDRDGGNGATGHVRIDADSVSNQPTRADRSRAAMVTAYSYDAANRVLDVVEGAQTLQADPTLDNRRLAAPDANGYANTRSRTFYDADGRAAAVLPPQAFSDVASLTEPNLDTARRVDHDLDGRPVATYSPRFSDDATSIGAGDDGDSGVNQQTQQCKTGRTYDAVAGIGGYGGDVGVCASWTEYDAIGQPAKQMLPTSNGDDNRFVEYSYTPDQLVSKITGPDPNGTGRVDVATTQYDGMGRPRWVEDANENKQQTSYTSDGLVSGTIGQAYTTKKLGTDGKVVKDGDGNDIEVQTTEEIAFAHDANGNIKTVTNAKGDVTTMSWTTDDLTAQVKAPGIDDDEFNVTEYGYDMVGNPTSVLMPQQNAKNDKAVRNEFTHDNLIRATHTPITDSVYRSVRYSYSPAGMKVATETARCGSGSIATCVPDNAAWDSAGSMRLTYGANGRVADEIGRDGESITTRYAQHGGQKSITDPTSDIEIEVGYYLDAMPRRVDDGLNENTYAYDASGQVTVRSDETGTNGVTGGDKVTTSYSYSDAGLPATTFSQVLDEVTQYSHDDGGRMTTAETGDHKNEWSWHPNNALAGAKTIADGSTIAEYVYRYDNNRNVTTQAVSGEGPEYTNTYAYNPAQNLTSWEYRPESGSAETTSYTWDANSNRTAATKGTASTTWSYRQDNSIDTRISDDTSDQQTAKTFDHTYDRAGRLVTDGCNTNAYDGFDRVKTVDLSPGPGDVCGPDGRSTTYTYDGLDRQRSIEVSGTNNGTEDVTTRSVFDGLTINLVGQVDADAGDNTKPDVLYQLDATGAAMAYEQSGEGEGKAFLDTDGRGNVTNVVGTDGNLDCAVVYDPFGEGVASGANGLCISGTADTAAAATGNAQWYRGQTRNGSTGDYQLGTRTYDPANGAFTTPDAYRVATPGTDLSVGSDPLTANTYTYVNGNPVNLYDPDGHASISPLGAEAAARRDNSEEAIAARWKNLTNAIRELNIAESKAAEAKKESEAEFDWEELATTTLKDVSGWTDIKQCIMDGDKTACLLAIGGVALAGFTKAGKIGKAVDNAIGSYKAFKKAKNVAKATYSRLQGEIDTLTARRDMLVDRISSAPRSTRAAKKPDARTEGPSRSSDKATSSKKESPAGPADNEGVSLSLKYKDGWSDAQRAAADRKVAALNEAGGRGELVVSPSIRARQSAAVRYKKAGGEVPEGSDVDHVIDLQLGGVDEIKNMSPLDLSVNRSLGPQIQARIKGLPHGTLVTSISIQ